jgi:pimeloyl-ACP methyl ester carboxylesterase
VRTPAILAPVLGTVLAAVALAGCGSTRSAHRAALSVRGQPVQILTPARIPPAPTVLVWFHAKGSGQSATSSPPRRAFFAALVRGGVIVASDRAGGDAWGNAASVADYRALIRFVTARYAPAKIVLAGESMGGLASLQIADDPPPRVVGWIGISPITNLAWARTVPYFAPGIRAARGRGPRRLRTGLPELWFASAGDPTVPPAENPAPGARRVRCSGPHLDASCRQPGVVLRFLARL